MGDDGVLGAATSPAASVASCRYTRRRHMPSGACRLSRGNALESPGDGTDAFLPGWGAIVRRALTVGTAPTQASADGSGIATRMRPGNPPGLVSRRGRQDGARDRWRRRSTAQAPLGRNGSPSHETGEQGGRNGQCHPDEDEGNGDRAGIIPSITGRQMRAAQVGRARATGCGKPRDERFTSSSLPLDCAHRGGG